MTDFRKTIVVKSSSVVEKYVRTKDDDVKIVSLNRSKAIANHCMECCGFSHVDRNECNSYLCSLWAFRFGGSAIACIKKSEKIEEKIIKDEGK